MDTEKSDTERNDSARMTIDRDHWTVYRTRFLVRARQLSQALSFTDILGREHHGEPGDYLVESSDGFRRIAPRTIFEDVYVPLASSEIGSETPRRFSERAAPRGAPAGCDRALSRRAHEDRLPTPAWSG
jgi:hypothetical protein